MNKLLKDLYDCFYTPPELLAQKKEIEECHQALIEVLEKPEPVKEAATALGSSPIQAPPSGEVQASPEQNATPPQETEPAPASPDSDPDNMVYVPGFGWIESQGPNHVEYAEDMYENGNKIGIMG